LEKNDRYKFNLLNKRFYSIVFPNITAQAPAIFVRTWDDWLQWGNSEYPIIIKRGLNVKIGKDSGIYYGEW